MKRTGLQLFFLLLLAGTVHAQVLPFRRFTPENGLASSRVWSLHQDRSGYLWAGCSGGLSRFNGTVFRNFDRERGVVQNTAFALAEDGSGRLWAGTYRGPCLYLPEEGRFVSTVDTASPVIGFTGLGNDFFCLTADGRLGRLTSKKSWTLTPLPPSDTGFSALASDGRFLYVGAGGKLLRMTPAPGSGPIQSVPAGAVINAVLPSPGERCCWVATDNGLYRLAEGSAIFEGPYPGTGNERLLCLCAGLDGALWVGGPRGVGYVSGGAVGWYGPRAGLGGTPVTKVLVDREGLLWIGTMNGISRLENRLIETYDENSGLPGSSTAAVVRDPRSDRIWISTNAGLFVRNGDRFEAVTAAGAFFSRFLAWSVLPRPDGSVWVGTDGGGIAILQGGRASYLTREDGLPGDSVSDLCEDGTGVVWAACRQGLARIEGGRVTAFNRSGGLPADHVRCLLPAADGRGILLGTVGGGLVRFDGTTFQRVVLPWKADVLGIYDLLRADGKLWIAADEGLFALDDAGRLSHWDTGSGLPDSSCVALLECGPGLLWVGTDGGAALFDTALGRVVKTLTAGDGLPGSEFTTHNCCCRAGDGSFWFGLVGGVCRIDPSVATTAAPTTAPPLACLDSVFLTLKGGGVRRVGLPPGAVLADDTRTIRFEFDLLKFLNPESVTAFARLEGYDDEFVPLGQSRVKEYTNLPSGNYAFVIRLAERGRPPVDRRLATFRVEPAIWQNPLFFCLAAVVLALAVHFGFRLRYRAIEREKEKLEQTVNQATRELEKKNTLLKHLAVTDELTGLYNRRFFLKALQQEVRRQARAMPGTEMSVLMVDVDHFKRINDNFGHEVGDWVLQHVARCLRSSVRVTDIPARFGGEEFIILLPQTGKDGARRVGEKIRLLLLAYPAERNNIRIPCSVSIGIAALGSPLDYTDGLIPEIIRRADAMLYRAKAEGRNRVVVEGSKSPLQTMEIRKETL